MRPNRPAGRRRFRSSGTFRAEILELRLHCAGHWYALTSAPAIWTQSEESAVSAGGHLVAINDRAEQEFIAQTFLAGQNRGQTYWIGLTDREVEGSFRWTTDEPVTFTKWNPGEPSDGWIFSGISEDYTSINWHLPRGRTADVGDWNDEPNGGVDGDLELGEPRRGIIEFDIEPIGRGFTYYGFSSTNGAESSWLYGTDLGADDRSSTLYRINPANGAVQTVGETGFEAVQDVAFAPDGRLFGIDPSGRLLRINRQTGAASLVGSHPGTNGLNALVASPVGVLYGATLSGFLVTLDPNSGITTTVGSLGDSWGTAGDLAFAPDGVLFATLDGFSSDSLAQIDTATGRATVIGSIGFSDVFSLAFSPDGALFAAANGYSDSPLLIQINPSTGAANWIAPLRTGAGMGGFAATTADIEPPRPRPSVASVLDDRSGARLLTGVGLPEVPVTFTATVSGATTSVRFTLGEVAVTDSDGGDGWSATIDVSKARVASDLVVVAANGNSDSEAFVHDVNLMALPAWMLQPNVELRPQFDWTSGYRFDLLLKHVEQGFTTPSTWWFLGDKWTGFRAGSTLRLTSSLDGNVEVVDSGYLVEGVILDFTAVRVVLPTNVSTKWFFPVGTSAAPELSWGDFLLIEKAQQPAGRKKPKPIKGGWFIEGSAAINVSVNDDLTFGVFDTATSLEVGVEGKGDNKLPWKLRYDGLRVPALGWAYVPPGVVDLALVLEASIGLAGRISVTTTNDLNQAMPVFESVSFGPKFFGNFSVAPEIQIGRGKLASAGIRFRGDLEQGLTASYARGAAWTYAAPGSFAAKAEVYVVLNAGKRTWDATLLTRHLTHRNWDLLASSGESPADSESLLSATKKQLTRMIRGWRR